VLFALAQPLSALALVVAFLLGILIRAVAQHRLAAALRVGGEPLVLRRIVDPIGAVGAALGGTGWGRPAPVTDVVRRTGSALWRRAVVYLAGIVLPIVAGEIVLAGFAALYPDVQQPYRPSDVLHGIPGPAGPQVLLTLGIALISFGIFALLPLPPCDGWGLLWLIWRRPGPQAQKVRYWLAERNLGVAILLLLVFPLGLRGALVYPVLDLLGTPLVRAW